MIDRSDVDTPSVVHSAEHQLRKAFVDALLHSGRSVCFATAEHGLRKASDHAPPTLRINPVPRVANASPKTSRTAVRTSLDPSFVPYATINSELNAGLGIGRLDRSPTSLGRGRGTTCGIATVRG